MSPQIETEKGASQTMIRKTVVLSLAGFLALGAPVLPAFAGGDEDLRAEITALKKQLSQLETRLAKQEAKEPEVRTVEGDLIPSWVRKVDLSGHVSASYVYNFDEPESGSNTLRVFDTEANDFQPNLFELVVEKPVSEDSRVGFRTDLHVGEDAEVTGAVTTGLGSTTDEFDLQQAYVEALLPVGNGLDMKFGKFTVLHGAEVTESQDNWNFSRSYLFGFAQALTHTGVRLSYPWADWISTTFGVNNGWDVVDDNNNGKTIEWQIATTPTEKTSFSVAGMFGPEQASDNHDDRGLIDITAGYNPTDRLSFLLNFDYGWEEDVVVEDQENGSWAGVAGYAKYQFNDWYGLAARAEYFADFDGVRTATGVGDLRLWSLTLTNQFNLYKDLIARLEYRHDHADTAVFTTGGRNDNTQDTVAVEMIYPF